MVHARMSTIGERLKEQREGLGYSQADFAASGGIKVRAQINYEQGKRMPDADYLARIAAAGADVNYILTGAVATVPPQLSGDRGGDLMLPADGTALNLAALIACIEGVEEGLADAGATLPPNKKAEVIAKWYQLHYAERDGKKLASVRRAVAELTRSYH